MENHLTSNPNRTFFGRFTIVRNGKTDNAEAFRFYAFKTVHKAPFTCSASVQQYKNAVILSINIFEHIDQFHSFIVES